MLVNDFFVIDVSMHQVANERLVSSFWYFNRDTEAEILAIPEDPVSQLPCGRDPIE